MARVPAKMYRKITKRPFTRRDYMGGVPGLRILQFHSGNKTQDFPVHLHLVPEEQGQIRHTALEAMRITAVRYLDKKAGRDNYHLHVRVYPHHVLRQNKQASGAGADRVSMGMRLSFGKPIGTAARIEANQPVMSIHTVARAIPFAKAALRKAQNKISMPCHLDIESSDKRSIEEMLAVAQARGTRALSGAGTVTEEAEAEEMGVDVEDLPEELREPEEEEDGGLAEGEEPPEGEEPAEGEEREGTKARDGTGDPGKGEGQA